MKVATRNKSAGVSRRLQIWIFPAIAVILAGVLGMMMLMLKGETQTTLQEPAYHYFMKSRSVYGEGVTLLTDTGRVVFDKEGVLNDSDSTPIYFENSSAILLTEDMVWVDTDGPTEWKVPVLSRLEKDEDGTVWLCGENRTRMDRGFLLGGVGTYVFLEPMQLYYQGEIKTMEPLSFYSVGQGLTRMYSYGTKEFSPMVSSDPEASAWVDMGYTVQLNTAICILVDGSHWMLSPSASYLDDITQYTN